MEQKNGDQGLLQLGDLARQAGMSLSAVKHCVREGLIRPAGRGARSGYGPETVERLRLIRQLHTERCYPLSVIRRILDSPEASEQERALLRAIHKVDGEEEAARLTATEAGRAVGLSPQLVAVVRAEGLVHPEQVGKKHLYGEEDLEIMRLIRRRMDAGIPFRQSVDAFKLYSDALEKAVVADVDSFTAANLLAPDFTAGTAVARIHVSDETLDRFVSLRRRALNRQYGARRVEDLARFGMALDSALAEMSEILTRYGCSEEAAQLLAAAQGPTGSMALDRMAGYYRRLGENRGDVTGSILACVDGITYFTTVRPAKAAGCSALTAWCMKLAWLTLAPEILGIGPAAETAWSRFRRLDGPEGMAGELEAALRRLERLEHPACCAAE